jgi:hypothetical protein
VAGTVPAKEKFTKYKHFFPHYHEESWFKYAKKGLNYLVIQSLSNADWFIVGTMVEWGNYWAKAIRMRDYKQTEAYAGMFSQIGELYNVKVR